MAQSDDLKTLRHWLRRPDSCVPSEVISQVCGIGISETLSSIPTTEIESLAFFVQHLIDNGKTGGFTQMWVAPDGPATGTAVPDGFVVQLHDAIQHFGNAESDGP